MEVIKHIKPAIETTDFIAATSIILGATYNLCASSYLTPFIISNTAHLGASYFFKYAVNNKIIAKEVAAIAEAALISATICLIFSGFDQGLNELMIAYSVGNWLSTQSLTKAIMVGTIPSLCSGVINKLSNHLYNKNNIEEPKIIPANEASTESTNIFKEAYNIFTSTILGSTCIDSIAHFTKYYVHLETFGGVLHGAPIGGALKYLISYIFAATKPENYKAGLGAVLGVVGAVNHTAYQLVNYGNDFTNICIASGIEMFDTVVASTAKNYFCNLVATQAEKPKEKTL